MGFFYFLGQKKFYLHLLISIALTLVIIWGVFKFLDVFTRHGEVYLVPNFSGQTVTELEQKGFNQYFDLLVIDSVYDIHHAPGSIVMQNPLPGAKVKKGRHVYLTIVAKTPEMVQMPDLRNLSLRQAMVLLEGKGLRVKQLQYVDYFAKNAVIDQLLNGEPVEPETKLPKGTAIGLVVGKGNNPVPVPLPFLIGKKKKEAHNALHYASLNVGKEYFLDTDDTTHARVYRTEPAYHSRSLLKLGSPVDIWYRSDENFDFKTYIQQMLTDTVQQDSIQPAAADTSSPTPLP
ncbi:MAG TPA: PASTA domain-containing protein [Bacteroidetes bacterium]|nr:PASTA domain-containing protein [Bacteroidota bacterium]